MTSSATILLAHGSSDPNWLAPFDQLSQQIQSGLSHPDHSLQLAYMELAEPSLEQTVAALHQQGITQIDVLPLFFAAGRHLRKDVPAQIDALEQAFPIRITLHKPVGLEPEVADAISNVVIRLIQR